MAGWTLDHKAAKNSEQAYAFIDYLYTPEVSAQLAEGSGYNPVITGADSKLSEAARKNFQEAYPGDALKKLWHRPPSRRGSPSCAPNTPTPSSLPDRILTDDKMAHVFLRGALRFCQYPRIPSMSNQHR